MSLREELLKELATLEEAQRTLVAKIAAVKLLLGPNPVVLEARFYGGGKGMLTDLGAETQEWVSSQASNFTVSEFIQFLRDNFGESFNEQAARNAFKKAVTDNPAIELIQQGEGRRPSVYRNR